MVFIPVDEPEFLFGDNQYVMENTYMPLSTLKNKSNAIAQHLI